MKTILRAAAPWVLLIGTGTLSVALAAEPLGGPLKPDEVARLYMKTFVNDDAQAGKALNDYLKPAYDGKDAFDMRMIGNLQRISRDYWEQALPETVKEAPLKMKPEDLSAALRAMFAASQVQAKQARCDVDQVRIEPNTTARNIMEGGKHDIAQVQFSCRIPTAADATLAALKRSTDTNDGAGFKRAALAYLDELKSGKRSKTVTGKASMHNSQTADGRWLTGDNEAWLAPVQDDMPQ